MGHSTRSIDELIGVLDDAEIARLVDVRTVPRSGRHPQFDQAALAHSLGAVGIGYEHERALGGFRRPRPDSPNGGWQVEAFRGYADHMASPEFREALERLMAGADRPTSVMCAEAQWWRCHRRLIADALVARGWRVLHLGLGPEPIEHELTPFAVVGPDHSLTYPPAQDRLGV